MFITPETEFKSSRIISNYVSETSLVQNYPKDP